MKLNGLQRRFDEVSIYGLKVGGEGHYQKRRMHTSPYLMAFVGLERDYELR